MDKVKQLLNEVGKQLNDQGFITKIFINSLDSNEGPKQYYRKTNSEIKHYSLDEIEEIKEKARYKENEVIIVIEGV